MTKLRFSVLPVGQGTGTLIEVLNANEESQETVLLDLGSLFWKVPETGDVSAEFVVERLKDVVGGPTLHAVFLSHGDADHINLIPSVLEEFERPGSGANRNEILEVQNVLFAGLPGDYIKHGVDVLGELERWMPVGAHIGPIDGSGQAPVVVTPAGVSYAVLAADTIADPVYAGMTPTTRTGSRSYLKNLVSLVLAIGFGTATKWIVATGDATGLSLLATYATLFADPTLVPAPILSLTLPHHGSVRTTYDLLGITTGGGSQEALVEALLQKLVLRLLPQSLSASAGEVARYRLARSKAIGDFGRNLPRSTFTDPVAGNNGMHFYTAYFTRFELEVVSDSRKRARAPARWPDDPAWHTVRSDKAIFTTDYFEHGAHPDASLPQAFPPEVRLADGAMAIDPPDVWVTGWAWTIDEHGTGAGPAMILPVDQVDHRYLELLERVHGPLPRDPFLFVPSAPEGAGLELEPRPQPAQVGAQTRGRNAPPPGRRRARVVP